MDRRVAIVGGAGHVGLPFGLVLCRAGYDVMLLDKNEAALALIREGQLPFLENDAEPLLKQALAENRLACTSQMGAVSTCDVVIVTIGTPVDEYLDPDIRTFDRIMETVIEGMVDGQLLIIRSTVFPGVTARLERRLAEAGRRLDVAYCPERIAQGYAIRELVELPQIVSSSTVEGLERASEFFGKMGAKVIPLTTVEAELAKLFANSFRYITFAISNQFYMLAEQHGASFEAIHKASTADYPRMRGFARAGFAAGPCLLKDTMQLASFNHNLFSLGQHAMMVNEGLPQFIVQQLKQTHDLSEMVVGIIGMAFKPDCDDSRSSLSYKLRKVLEFEAKEVVCTDPYVVDPDLVPLENVLERAELIVVGAPHQIYRGITFRQPVIDVAGVLSKSSP
ncbi:MAG: nucleotide sugar dehydrogenase [Planctomyces sp.]|jgi:UDP-N-acetyl-D-mannosaminuronic acid dehydrogenase|nr:nucleotide sugar dehydrogenase [Planctomyces sp.]